MAGEAKAPVLYVLDERRVFGALRRAFPAVPKGEIDRAVKEVLAAGTKAEQMETKGELGADLDRSFFCDEVCVVGRAVHEGRQVLVLEPKKG